MPRRHSTSSGTLLRTSPSKFLNTLAYRSLLVLNLCVFTSHYFTTCHARHARSMLGLQDVARDSTLARCLEIPLFKVDRNGSHSSQGPIFCCRMVCIDVGLRDRD